MNFAEEQINKAKTVKSAEELLELAKANGIELTEEQAKAYFAELHHEVELSDEELEAVAGGYKTTAADWLNAGEIVVDVAGVQYEIQGYDSTDYTSDGGVRVVWFRAIVKYVPESAKVFTSLKEGDVHYVNSGIVEKI